MLQNNLAGFWQLGVPHAHQHRSSIHRGVNNVQRSVGVSWPAADCASKLQLACGREQAQRLVTFHATNLAKKAAIACMARGLTSG